MAVITMEDRIHTLESIRDLSVPTQAKEVDPSDCFLMSGSEALGNPNRFLVLGPQGIGKTTLFRALLSPDGFRRITKGQVLSPENCTVVPGYCRSNDFPHGDTMNPYTRDKRAKFFWIGSLLFSLAALPKDGKYFSWIMYREFGYMQSSVFWGPQNQLKPYLWSDFIPSKPELWVTALDTFDRYLESTDRWVIVAYDDLDELTVWHMDLFPLLRALLSFWANYTQRWKRLRCKIFLRDDLFASRHLNFLDASELSGSTMRLKWDVFSLYRLLIQKMIDSGSKAALDYLDNVPGLLKNTAHSSGNRPTFKESVLQEFVSRLMGTASGNSPLPNPPYRWPIHHLQDANGTLTPGSFLRYFSTAAERMLRSKKAMASLTGDQLILPSILKSTIPAVSRARVAELQNKNPWLEKLKVLFQGLSVPMDRDSFVELLDVDLWEDAPWVRLPGQTRFDIYFALQDLGIISVWDHRVYIPELYRHAFGMR